MTIREEIESVLKAALEQAYPLLDHLRFETYQPREKAFGDFASNVAILVGRALGVSPMDVAEKIAERVRTAAAISSIEIAKPGFINISISPEVYLRKLSEIVTCKDQEGYGSGTVGGGKLVQVEFVSANPTGPLNVVSARAAAVGDVLVRLLRRTGHDARSEFYVNDAGTQFELLGRSLEARFREGLGEKSEIPENGYPGEYLVAIARRVNGLADWADRQMEEEGGRPEPAGDREARLIDDFISREAGTQRPGENEARSYLSEYGSFKQALTPDQCCFWAPLYVCNLSRQRLGMEEITSRLVWMDRYRSFLRAACGKDEPGQEHTLLPAARVFLGEAIAGRRFDFSRFAVERIVEGQRASLERFGNRPEGGLKFDTWVRESTLEDLIARVSGKLVSDGRFVYEKDGAVWLKGGEEASGSCEDKQGRHGKRAGVGDPAKPEMEETGEKDEWVIRRRTGQPTYFLTDIAYHIDKRKRGFEHVIDIWGPDHHGHVARMKTAMRIASQVMPDLAIGENWLDVLIAQQVNLVREGKRIQMSKRAGEYVTLDDVVSEVGADAARFFFLMRRCNSHLDFDLDLAKKTSEENPVYYIQYAHARISSIMEFAKGSGFEHLPPEGDLALLQTEEEVDLIKALADFDEVVKSSALALEPHRIVTYLIDLAGRFHRFYHNHRVVTEDRPLSEARLCLSWAMRTVLRSALYLIGVSAPVSM